MDAHHLIRMDESSRIDEYMSDDRSCVGIFFEYECEYSTRSELCAVLQGVSRYDTDRLLISVERIECELQSIAKDLRTHDIDDLSRTECDIFLFEAIARRCPRECRVRWSRSTLSFDRMDRVDISCISRRDRESRRSILQWEIPDLTILTLRWEELEEATLIEKYCILHRIANIRDNISRTIHKRKSKCLEHHLEELYIESRLKEYPPGKVIFLTLDESHISECRIGLSGILYARIPCTDQECHISSTSKHERIRNCRSWEEDESEYIGWKWREICRLHRRDEARETRCKWEWSRWHHRGHSSTRTRSIVTRRRCLTQTRTLGMRTISILSSLWTHIFRHTRSRCTDRAGRRQSYTESDIISITKNTSHK